MPFERYLLYNGAEHARDDQAANHQQSTSAYSDYAAPSRSESYQYDPSIFSGNVQFQMPQLMLGPSIAPGGGAEVLPAGMVGRPSALAPNWLSSTPFRNTRNDWYAATLAVNDIRLTAMPP